MEVDRGYGDGTYRLHSINFTGRLVQLIEEGYTTMRLYEWVDRGYVVYLVHVEEDKSGRLPRRTLYPFINTHFGRVTPTKGYTAEEVSGLTRNSPTGSFWASPKFANEVGGTPLQTCCIGRVPLQREACGKGEEACRQKRTRPSSAVGSRVRLGRRGSRCLSKSVAGRRPSGRGRT